MIKTYHSNYEVVGKIKQFSEKSIMREQSKMLFGCDLKTSLNKGGIITKEFIKNLPDRFLHDPNLIIDTKVTMLMKGMLPCIGGWHLDNIKRVNGQPDFINSGNAEHIIMIMGDCSRTEFIKDTIYVTIPDKSKIAFREMANEIDTFASPITHFANSGEMYHINNQSWHRGTPATENGWRYFIRASINHDRKFENQKRHQVQVYLDNQNNSW